MGGGDLNMKKSWHPVLLVNQERVWKAEKTVNEERKKLNQLRKEQEEERQLAELQRLQEQATGKKRVDKLDWMYAAPSNEGGALGNAKISQSQMEDYLLGKRRVDEVLAAEDKNVGNMDKEFIAVQNANSARDTAAKIREDPLLAIRRQEQEAVKALANRPDIRRQLKAAAKENKESKEERRARRKAEKEDRRRERHERHERKRRRSDDWSPRSDYSEDDRDRRRSYTDRRREDYRERDRGRSSSPRRERDSRDERPRDRSGDKGGYDDRNYRRGSEERKYRDESPRRYRDERDRSSRHRDDSPRVKRERSDERDDRRVPPPRSRPHEEEYMNVDRRHNGNGHPNGGGHANGNGYTNGHGDQHGPRQVKPHPARPSALDMADRPTSSRPPTNGANSTNGNPAANNTAALDDMRAARLAAMSASAHDLQSERDKTLQTRAEEQRREAEKDERMRQKYGKDAVNASFFKAQSNMGLGEALGRRAGKGLQRERDL